MKDTKGKSGITRRSFMKTVGTGALGTTILANLPQVEADAREEERETPRSGSVLLSFTVNGQHRRVMVDQRDTLLQVLRDKLGLTGTKLTCNRGMCGACTILLEDVPVYSCHMLALDVEGKRVTTIEGLLSGEELHPLQRAFVSEDGLQCGFCTPGQIMAAQGLLLKNPHPTREQVLEGMSGNLCRCSAYPKIVDSVLETAK